MSRVSQTFGALVAWSALAAMLLVAPAAAGDDWQVVHPPGGVQAVEVGGPRTWLVEPTWECCTARFEVTEDGGATWSTVEIADFPIVVRAGAAADGSFRLLAGRGIPEEREARVFAVSAAGAVPLGPILKGDNPIYDAAAVSADGATWVPHRDPSGGDSFVLSIVAADGSVAEVPLPDAAETYGWKAMRTVFGMRLLRYLAVPSSPGSFRREKTTYRLDPGGNLETAEPYPVSLRDGEWLTSDGFGVSSWDGGAHWAVGSANVVPRLPPGEMPRYLISDGRAVADRFAPFLFRASALQLPQGAYSNSVVDAGSVLVAWGVDGVFVHDAALPAPPATTGDLQPDAQRMLDRANLFRADAGLPPLIGDARISAAAHNHSVYTTLNSTEASLDAHFERAGNPGFTGNAPGDRCAAAGADCNSEVMYGPGVADPVGGWLATIYHRPLLGSPRATAVGAGEAPGGWAVMDGGSDDNLLVAPFGYPTGRWRGESGFYGEIPDPVSACQAQGQQVDYPLGIAVSLYLPSDYGSVSGIEVRRHGDPIPLRGCLQEDYDGSAPVGVFILDDPLVPGESYDVSGHWIAGIEDPFLGGSEGPELTHSWSFRFDPDPLARGTSEDHDLCRSLSLRTIKSVARKHRGHGRGWQLGIEEKVTLKQKARVHLQRALLYYWKAKKRYKVKLRLGALRRKQKVVGKTSYLRFRLPDRVVPRVEAGEAAELILTFTGRRLHGCPRVAHLSRVRKIGFGWVRLRGAAAWVSGGSKKRR